MDSSHLKSLGSRRAQGASGGLPGRTRAGSAGGCGRSRGSLGAAVTLGHPQRGAGSGPLPATGRRVQVAAARPRGCSDLRGDGDHPSNALKKQKTKLDVHGTLPRVRPETAGHPRAAGPHHHRVHEPLLPGTTHPAVTLTAAPRVRPGAPRTGLTGEPSERSRRAGRGRASGGAREPAAGATFT